VTTKLHADAVAALRAIPAHPDMNGAYSPYFFWNGKSKLSTLVGSLRRSMASLKRITEINIHPHRFRDTFALSCWSKARTSERYSYCSDKRASRRQKSITLISSNPPRNGYTKQSANWISPGETLPPAR
jgi:hypothetical protein